MDSIQVTAIRCYGYTGLLAEEKKLGQWFEVDLTLWVDLAKSGATDNISDTLDYREAIAKVKQIVKNSKFDLVEKLAATIAEEILQQEMVTQVRVQLHKPAAPIPDFGGKITIDITRSRPE